MMMKIFFIIGLMCSNVMLYSQFKSVIEVGNSVELLRKFMIDPDSIQLSNLLSDQLSYGHSSGKIESKSEFLANLLNGNSDFTEIFLSDQKITGTENSAVVRHNLTAKTIDKGVPGNIKLHIMTVWVKEKKQWKLFARQATRLNP
jgi:hypothetical protein